MLIKALKNVGPVDAGSYLPDEIVNTPGFNLQRLLDLDVVEVESGYTPAVDHELLAHFALQGEREQLQKEREQLQKEREELQKEREELQKEREELQKEREEFEQAKAAFQVERDQLLANIDGAPDQTALQQAYTQLLTDFISIVPTAESALKGLTEPALRIVAKHLGIEAQPENKAELITLIMLAQKQDN
jgi:predicted nuclease with TOPRIM domain